MTSIFGIDVIEHPLMPDKQPRMKLSSKVAVSDKFRVEFDAWLLEFFGEERVAYVISGKWMFASPQNMAILRNYIYD